MSKCIFWIYANCRFAAKDEELSSAYLPFKQKVQEHAEKNTYPFKGWFGSGSRVYIPIPSRELERPEVEKSFEEQLNLELLNIKKFLSNNETLTELLDGLEFTNVKESDQTIILYDSQKKSYTYMPITQALNHIGKSSYGSDESNLAIKYLKNLKVLNYQINNSKITFKEYVIVISQDPDDVATMSTGTSWGSCMTLGSGMKHKDVFCDVEAGTLIAYLFRAKDVDVDQDLIKLQKAIGRVLIRRFVNDQGKSLAIREDRFYGSGGEILGWGDIVANWLRERQNGIGVSNDMVKTEEESVYTRQGGEWSDTLYKKYTNGFNYVKEEITRFLNDFHFSINTRGSNYDPNLKVFIAETKDSLRENIAIKIVIRYYKFEERFIYDLYVIDSLVSQNVKSSTDFYSLNDLFNSIRPELIKLVNEYSNAPKGWTSVWDLA